MSILCHNFILMIANMLQFVIFLMLCVFNIVNNLTYEIKKNLSIFDVLKLHEKRV